MIPIEQTPEPLGVGHSGAASSSSRSNSTSTSAAIRSRRAASKAWRPSIRPSPRAAFAQSARASLVYGPISSFAWGLEHGRATQTLLMFVLGMLAGRYRLFYDEGRNRRIWGGSLAAGILGTWLVPFEAMRNSDDGDGHRRGGGPVAVRTAGIPAGAARS